MKYNKELLECSKKLMKYNKELLECSKKLMKYNKELLECSKKLMKYNKELLECSKKLMKYNKELLECSKKLMKYNKELLECSKKLMKYNKELLECSKKLMKYKKNLVKCNLFYKNKVRFKCFTFMPVFTTKQLYKIIGNKKICLILVTRLKVQSLSEELALLMIKRNWPNATFPSKKKSITSLTYLSNKSCYCCCWSFKIILSWDVDLICNPSTNMITKLNIFIRIIK